MKKILKLIPLGLASIAAVSTLVSCGDDYDSKEEASAQEVVSIVSFKKSATGDTEDTYTITYSNGKTEDIKFAKGGGSSSVSISDDGYWVIDGRKSDVKASGVGIKSIAKTSTAGNVDTYTITYTNNTISSFQVTNGKSAYQIAQANGYTGTEAQWLASLIGDDGKDGREVEFSVDSGYIVYRYKGDTTWINLVALSTLAGTNGKEVTITADEDEIKWKYVGDTAWTTLVTRASLKGTDGKSAYDIYKETVPTTDTPMTENEWLASLTGEDGKSAYDIAKENGFVGTVDEWLASLKGVGVANISVEVTGDTMCYIYTMTDGTIKKVYVDYVSTQKLSPTGGTIESDNVSIEYGANSGSATSDVSLTVTPKSSDDAEFAVDINDSQSTKSYDINLTGLPENTEVTVSINIGTGLGAVKMYHNNELIDSTYNSETGIVTFVTSSFSPYTTVYNSNVINIATASEFKDLFTNYDTLIAQNPDGICVNLTADIDLTQIQETFAINSSGSNPSKVNINGNNHKLIYGNVNHGSNAWGLFGYWSGTFENVKLYYRSTDDTTELEPLFYVIKDNSTISNVDIYAIDGENSPKALGSKIVENNDAILANHIMGSNVMINDVDNYATIISSDHYTGVIVGGYLYKNYTNVVFKNCDNYGSLHAQDAGFILGNSYCTNIYASNVDTVSNYLQVINCVNHGEIIGSRSAGLIAPLTNISYCNNVLTSVGSEFKNEGTINVYSINLDNITISIDETTNEISIVNSDNINSEIAYYKIILKVYVISSSGTSLRALLSDEIQTNSASQASGIKKIGVAIGDGTKEEFSIVDGKYVLINTNAEGWEFTSTSSPVYQLVAYNSLGQQIGVKTII